VPESARRAGIRAFSLAAMVGIVLAVLDLAGQLQL
jgi:hypothetical protein